MTSHMIAWSEALDNVTDSEIDAVNDDVLTLYNAERFNVPTEYNYVHQLVAFGATIVRSRIDTPSLEVRRSRMYIIPHNRSAAPSVMTPKVFKPDRAVALLPSEALSARVTYPDVAAAERVNILCKLGKAELDPVPSGDVRVVRATATAALTANQWTSVAVTPEVQLEAGTYALVNFIPYSANLVACRAIIQGQAWRPGVVGINGPTEEQALDFTSDWNRYNIPHLMGTFPHNVLPQFQFLANAADTAEIVYLHLIKTG